MELPITDTIIIAISKLIDDAQVDSREPTHYDLETQIKKAELIAVDPKAQGHTFGKAKRIRAILNWAIDNDTQKGSVLISLILSQVRAVGGFRESSPNFVGTEQIQNSISAFETENFVLLENGEIQPKVLETLSGKHLTEALKKYAERAKQGSEDAALLSGTGKDLIEATAKHIIQTKFGGLQGNANFPTLLGQTYAALKMSTPEDTKVPNEPAIKDYERAIFNLAIMINRVRNKEGTGHGRLCITELSDNESHSIIQSVGIVADFLLNRLNESN